jgi:N,N'-diacetyllegionaminate synthase
MSVLIIAEAGVNHNGDIEIAKKLVDAASSAGANFIKFQTFSADRLVTRNALKARYQSNAIGEDESQYDMLRKLELTDDMHRELMEHSIKRDIGFLSTGFDIEGVNFLHSLGQRVFKIPSGEITNLPYLRHIGKLGSKIILSTGMSSLGDVESALDLIKSSGTSCADITLLHCTTEYPAPFKDVNLRAMQTMGSAFGLKVGYSDHTLGIEVAIAAVAIGACVIEKHFTLDRTMEGPDHKASLEPRELTNMVQAIRNIESAMGDGVKRIMPSEAQNVVIVRKSLVASRQIKAGEIFTAENMVLKRPGNGISAMRWDEVLGKCAKRDFLADELIEI